MTGTMMAKIPAAPRYVHNILGLFSFTVRSIPAYRKFITSRKSETKSKKIKSPRCIFKLSHKTDDANVKKSTRQITKGLSNF